MASKKEAKAIMQSPNKGSSYAAAVSGNIADRTRGAAGRRLSREGLESIASEADLASYDTDHSSGSSTRPPIVQSSVSVSSSLANPPAPTMMVDAEWQQIIQLLLTKATSGVPAKAHAAPSTNTPRPAVPPLMPAVPAVPSSPAIPSLSTSSGVTIEPSVQRLISAVATGSGTPTPLGGANTLIPGAPINNGHEDDSDDSGSDDDSKSSSANILSWGHIHVAERDRWAPDAVRMTRAHYQSFQGRATVVRCKDIRNKHEVDTLSIIADAALAGRNDIVLEIAVRRIAGVEDADNGGGRDWDTATILDLAKPGTLGSDHQRRRVRRDAAQLKANRKAAGGATNAGRSRTAAGTGGPWQKKKKKGYGGSGTRPSGLGSPATKA